MTLSHTSGTDRVRCSPQAQLCEHLSLWAAGPCGLLSRLRARRCLVAAPPRARARCSPSRVPPAFSFCTDTSWTMSVGGRLVVQGGGPQEGQLRQLRATSPWRPRSHLCSEGPREATAGGRGCSRWGLSLGARKPQMASRALHVAPALGAASSPPAPTPGFPWAPLHRPLASLPPPRDSFSTSSSTSFLKPRSLCSSVSWNARDVPEGAALPSVPSPVRVCASVCQAEMKRLTTLIL